MTAPSASVISINGDAEDFYREDPPSYEQTNAATSSAHAQPAQYPHGSHQVPNNSKGGEKNAKKCATCSKKKKTV